MNQKTNINRDANDAAAYSDSPLSNDVLKRGRENRDDASAEQETDLDPESPLAELAGGPESALDDDDIEDEIARPDAEREANGPVDRIIEPEGEKATRSYSHEE